MGVSESRPDPKTPLGCLLKNFSKLGYTQTLKAKRLISLSQQQWPQYPLDNQSRWPPTGTFDFNVLTDLDNYCRRTGKDSEVPYVQAFWDIRSRPDLCSPCSTRQILLAISNPPLPTAPPFPKNPDPPAAPPPPKTSDSTDNPDLIDLLSSPPPYRPPDRAVRPPTSPVVPETPSVPSPPPKSPAQEPEPQPSSLSSPVASHTRSHSSTPAPLCPLREVAGAKVWSGFMSPSHSKISPKLRNA